MIDNYIHFTDEEIESTDYTFNENVLVIDNKEYWIKAGTATGFYVIEK